MLKAIFYARFHPERGPSVIHQYPDSSIRSTRATPPLLAWSDISSYIIPPYDVCNQSLSICTNGYRVLGHPISIEDGKYDRNRFTFNVCFVLNEEEAVGSWEQIVRKVGKFFRMIEEGEGLLRREETLEGLKWAGEEGYPAKDVGIVRGILERTWEDLNAFGEMCVRVDDQNVLNLQLSVERVKERPARIRAWDVPLLIRPLPSPSEWTWDLTLQRIYPLINGIHHASQIASKADVELKLVKATLRELVYHNRAIILDIFHFSAIYTCSAQITTFIQETDLQDECRNYISLDPSAEETLPTGEEVIELYTLLQPGYQLSDFCLTYRSRLTHIDVRRFITFGIIKNLLRRVHKFALASETINHFPSRKDKTSSSSPAKLPKSNEDAVREFDRAWRKAALTSGWATPPPDVTSLGKSHKSAESVRSEEDEKLRAFLDGMHCMDEICVAMKLSERKVLERLRSGRFGEVVVFNK